MGMAECPQWCVGQQPWVQGAWTGVAAPAWTRVPSLGWGQQWLTGLDTCGTLSGSGVEQVREGTIHLKSLCGLRDEGVTHGWQWGFL